MYIYSTIVRFGWMLSFAVTTTHSFLHSPNNKLPHHLIRLRPLSSLVLPNTQSAIISTKKPFFVHHYHNNNHNHNYNHCHHYAYNLYHSSSQLRASNTINDNHNHDNHNHNDNDSINAPKEKNENMKQELKTPESQVCVLLPTQTQEEHDDPSTSTTTLSSLSSLQKECEQVAKEIATHLKLPLLFYNDETMEYRKLLENEHENESKSNNDSNIDVPIPIQSFQHCIRVIPYSFPLSETNTTTATATATTTTTYAISIQPIEPTQNSKSSSRKKKVTKKQKKLASLGSNIGSIQPVFIDFCASSDSSPMGKRLKSVSSKGGGGEMLLKAVAPSKLTTTTTTTTTTRETGKGAVVYDMTAGFGQDAALIALGGASQVVMMERDPIVALLLKDALRRLDLFASSFNNNNNNNYNHNTNSKHVQQTLELSQKLSLIVGDGVDILKSPSCNTTTLSPPDVCYLDPMFPARTKSAAVKKNMQVLHGLLSTHEVQTSEEENIRTLSEFQLLESALNVARRRVVVKRPIHAALLGEGGSETTIRKPSFDIRGSINRWDVYIINNNNNNT